MKNLFTICILFVVGLSGFSQCNFDSLSLNGPHPTFTQQSIGHFDKRCTNCNPTKCVAWELPFSFVGDIGFYSVDSAAVEIQITTRCHFLLLDTCAIIPPSSITGNVLIIPFATSKDAQVYVCGELRDSITCDIKTTPIQIEEIDSVIIDLRTCAVPVGIDKPALTCKEFEYYDIIHYRDVSVSNSGILPKGLYWRWCGQWSNGEKVLIQ